MYKKRCEGRGKSETMMVLNMINKLYGGGRGVVNICNSTLLKGVKRKIMSWWKEKANVVCE